MINKDMVFKDSEALTSLYEGISKCVKPSEDQLIRQAPLVNKNELNGTNNLLEEAYKAVDKKMVCKHAAKGCKCDGCKDCKANQKPLEEAKKKAKPDYLDVDKDGNKKESMKKALKDKQNKKPMKEGISSFKDLFQKVISEGKFDPKMSFGPEPIVPHLESDRKKLDLRRMSNGEITEINDEEQYIVRWKNPEKHNNQQEQPLKGESVHSWLKDIQSIRRAFPEEK